MSAVNVYDSQGYRNIDMTRERISLILEPCSCTNGDAFPGTDFVWCISRILSTSALIRSGKRGPCLARQLKQNTGLWRVEPACERLRRGMRTNDAHPPYQVGYSMPDIKAELCPHLELVRTRIEKHSAVDGTQVEGLITPTLAIKANTDGTHEAQRQYTAEPNAYNDYLEIPAEVRQYEAEAHSSKSSRGVLSVTAELYVIVDSSLAQLLGSNRKVKQYLSVFWNGVQKRFDTITDPKVKLVLSGALIVRDSADETYINDNVLLKNYIHGENTLNSISDWLFEKKGSLPAYDVAYLMTGKDMADVESGMIQKGLAGIAWKGAACVVASGNKRSFNTAMGEDMGAYYVGVMTAAHELAHNLGSPHDGKDGAEACSWDDGYIMSYVGGKSNKLFFSSCSQKLMKDYMTSSDAACLQTTEVGEQISLSSQLPGEKISMDEQCVKQTGKADAYASKSVSEDSLCVQLVCQWQVKDGYSIWTYTQSTGRPAAEGSACKSGGYCINGSCKEV
ncbi:A disintegrin and metalloproteinase with thrombospondin motifs 18-like [Penaeus japonicus]|uniref:A disintegrin and metalloproteinase with thrombospondin motifs 18-like n=1 Tax=Penaeus japonicus TaxID=27405 RepID=UPI001C70D908|nr:A disintegrin and metalloproteinase with thrombospondin motifs 18-like [Penaeus japonicus]